MKNKGIELYRSQNIKKTLQIIRNNDGITRRQLQKRTGLSFATISSACNELVEKDIVYETGHNNTNGGAGRIPKILYIKELSYFGLCIDLQNRSEVLIVLRGICNTECFHASVKYTDPKDIDGIIDSIWNAFNNNMVNHNIPMNRIIGIGVSISGIFDLENQSIQECTIAEWEGCNLKEKIEKVFGISTYVDNFTSLMVSRFVSDIDKSGKTVNTAYIHVGEGLGIGIISHGHLLRGARGYAAEICHLPVGNSDIKCPRCGNYGCAENELSKRGFCSKYLARTNNDRDILSWDDFIALVENKDPHALEVVKENSEILAKCVAFILTIFDPDELHIGGSIYEIYDLMESTVTRRTESLGINYSHIPIILDSTGQDGLIDGIMERIIYRWDP